LNYEFIESVYTQEIKLCSHLVGIFLNHLGFIVRQNQVTVVSPYSTGFVIVLWKPGFRKLGDVYGIDVITKRLTKREPVEVEDVKDVRFKDVAFVSQEVVNPFTVIGESY
jgi:hypothetical protein